MPPRRVSQAALPFGQKLPLRIDFNFCRLPMVKWNLDIKQHANRLPLIEAEASCQPQWIPIGLDRVAATRSQFTSRSCWCARGGPEGAKEESQETEERRR